MKTTRTRIWVAAYAAVLTAAAADQTTMAAGPEKSYTGTVVSVDPKENMLKANGFVLSRQFNLGTGCSYALLDKNPGAATDLRPGEKITVSYQDSHGVLIADRVEQLPMRYEGMVKAIDLPAHELTVHLRGMDKTFQIADGCGVMLWDEKTGTLADIQTGDHVTVTYETPGDTLMARQIAQTSMEFTGTLTAIDLGEKTLKAKAMFGSKKFNVADNCAIVINGRTDGQLSELKPNDKLVFNYDEINGVNVVNRIAPARAQPSSVATTTAPTTPTTGY